MYIGKKTSEAPDSRPHVLVRDRHQGRFPYAVSTRHLCDTCKQHTSGFGHFKEPANHIAIQQMKLPQLLGRSMPADSPLSPSTTTHSTTSLVDISSSTYALSAFLFSFSSSFNSTVSTSIGGLNPSPFARFHRFMRAMPIHGPNWLERSK